MLEKLNELLFCLPWPWPFVVITFSMVAIAAVACLTKHLSLSGASAACILGICVIRTLRFEGFFLFLAFYLTCNIVGKVSSLKRGETGIESKGSTRDWIQVFANGLCAAMMGFCWFYSGKSMFLVGFGASVAESTADTWAGEIGKMGKGLPFDLRSFRPVEKGTSGAISVLGTFSGILACLFIAFLWYVFFGIKGFAVIVFSGFAGCMFDSLLGSYCQALYKDPRTGKHTEKPVGELVKGKRWIDNDMVNFISNLFSCVLALSFSLFRL